MKLKLTLLASTLMAASLLSGCNDTPTKPDETAAATASVQVLAADFGLLGDGDALTKTTLVPLVIGQTYGWRVKLKTNRTTIKWREEFTTPTAPASWGNLAETQTISADQRVSVIEGESTLDASKTFSKGWAVHAGDPQGRHTIRLTIEGVATP